MRFVLPVFTLSILGLILVVSLFSFPSTSKGMDVADTIQTELPENAELLTLAGGCFWCLESEFRAKNGVVYTISGYTGGKTDNPTYGDITTGKTGHAEATEIYFDPTIISAREILEYFFKIAHDPTQLNRQGVDKGTQYRSAVFYEDTEQKELVETIIAEVNASKAWKKPIVTTLEPAQKFWPAEEYHQQYYEKYEAENGRPHIRVLYKQKKKAL